MRIDESYFQRLLNSGDALSAIADLSAIWSARPGRSETQPYFGLSEPEFNVHMVLWYTGEVGNGGHAQFFLNPIGRYASRVLGALMAIGLTRMAATLQQAAEPFGGIDAIPDEERCESILEMLSSAEERMLDTADREIASQIRDSAHACLAYLRQHAAVVLRPEREA